jgi:trans-aconitate methyltransferase
MIRPTGSLDPSYFESVYAADLDPWKFASSAYESNKYALTLEALPMSRYASGFEIGCSIGVLTRQLALRCDALLAIDAASAPLVEARRRCSALPNVRFEQMFVPTDWPSERFDLIVLSEVVYYLSAEDVDRLVARVATALIPQGTVILVHWTGETNYPLTGDQAADLFIDRIDQAAKVIRHDRREAFRLDVLVGR